MSENVDHIHATADRHLSGYGRKRPNYVTLFAEVLPCFGFTLNVDDHEAEPYTAKMK